VFAVRSILIVSLAPSAFADIAEVGEDEVCTAEVCPTEVSASKVGAAEVLVASFGALEVAL
jgi:hypothetical protein